MIPKLLKKVIAECDLKWQCEPRTSQGKHRICRPQASDGIANRQRTHAVNSPDCQPTCIVGCDLLSESHPAEEKPVEIAERETQQYIERVMLGAGEAHSGLLQNPADSKYRVESNPGGDSDSRFARVRQNALQRLFAPFPW